jgi:hypothetical protein
MKGYMIIAGIKWRLRPSVHILHLQNYKIVNRWLTPEFVQIILFSFV